MAKQIKRYTCGFAFITCAEAPDIEHVLLVQKNKPEWQAGKYNGIGGKVETDRERRWPELCMVREFKEETGIDTNKSDWREFVRYDGQLAEPYPYIVHFFCTRLHMTRAEMCEFHRKKRALYVFTLYNNQVSLSNTVNNLRWLIPLALDSYVHGRATVIGV